MTRYVWLAVTVLSFTFNSASASELPSTGARLLNFDNPNRILNSYFVGFKKEADARAAMRQFPGRALALADVLPVTPANVEALSHALADSVGARVTLVLDRMPSTKGFWAQMTEQQAKRLANDPRVAYIEANMPVEVTGLQSLPADNSKWHLDRIDQANTPLNRYYSYDSDMLGAGVQAFIIDTGVRTTHTEFIRGSNGTILSYVKDCSESGSNSYCERLYSCIGGQCMDLNEISDPDDQDCLGHGTNTASLFGGQTRGVARKSLIRPIKFTTGCTGAGTSESLSRAISYADFNSGTIPSLVVMPLATAGSTVIDSMVGDLVGGGITVVTGAGNNGANACNYSPARMGASSSVITVGAINISDQRWSGSNYGNCVTLFAPGENVTGADSDSNTDTAAWDGTSQAAPIAAGVAAILKGLRIYGTTDLKAALVAAATDNTLTNIGTNSPNKLLYSLVDATEPPDDPTVFEKVLSTVIVPYLIM